MRQILLAGLLLLGSTVSASDELYIVPAFATNLSNGTTRWDSEVLLTNPHEHAVTLELELVVGQLEPMACRFAEFSLGFPPTLAPGETRLACIPFSAAGAFAFRASDTLVVTSEMTAARRLGELIVTTRQPVEPGRSWIEPGQVAMIPNVRIDAASIRANLIVVNPGNDDIKVRYRLVRTGSAPPSNHEYEPAEGDLDVKAHSMTSVPLLEGPRYACGRLIPCTNAVEHQLLIEASGRFYAGTSSIEGDLDATFRGPLVIR